MIDLLNAGFVFRIQVQIVDRFERDFPKHATRANLITPALGRFKLMEGKAFLPR